VTNPDEDKKRLDSRSGGMSEVSGAPPEVDWLRLSDVTLAFGGVRALQGVSFEVAPGAIHAIIGPNGAGKTTLLNCISGRFRPSGSIRLGEVQLTQVRPERRIRLGVARTFQNIAVFPEQTVLQNVMVGGHHRLRSGLLGSCLYWGPFGCEQEERALRGEALAVLQRLGLERLAQAPAGELSYGQQKRLELGRALLAHPRLLLLDEPMAGMTRAEKRELCQLIAQINRETGSTVLMIEHDMSVVRTISTQVTVMDFGQKIAEGPPAEVVADERVRRAYLGEDI
jgi:branched-chain amino acid transport system ATP-binding protein